MNNPDLISLDNMYFDTFCCFVPNRLFCDPEVKKLLDKETEVE